MRSATPPPPTKYHHTTHILTHTHAQSPKMVVEVRGHTGDGDVALELLGEPLCFIAPSLGRCDRGLREYLGQDLPHMSTSSLAGNRLPH